MATRRTMYGAGQEGQTASENGRRRLAAARTPSAQQLGARGTGLGLAMVVEIVSAHDGKVTLSSSPGEGSTFTLTLGGSE
jgi:signal transduction histidine kinase